VDIEGFQLHITRLPNYPIPLVRPLHFVLHAVRQLLDLFGLPEHFNRKNVFIRFVHVRFQFPGQFH